MTLHIDGFDQFQDDQRFRAAMERAGYGTAGSIASVTARTGIGVGCQGANFSRPHQWLTNHFSVGCAMQFSERGSVLWLDFGNDERVVLWTSPDDGLPRLNDNAGGALPVKATWYYFEVVLDRVGGTASLFINNKADAVAPLTPTMLAATQISVHFGMLAPSTYRPGITIADNAQKTYDDLYIRDGSRLGPIVITTRVPQFDDLIEWAYTAEEGGSAEILAKRPPDPLNAYIASDQYDAQDRFKSLTPLASDKPILATALAVLTRKSPGFPALLGGFIGDGAGANYRGKTVEVDNEWRLRYLVFGAEGGDTKANIETAPFGVVVREP